jgi:hypothetical protein
MIRKAIVETYMRSLYWINDCVNGAASRLTARWFHEKL